MPRWTVRLFIGVYLTAIACGVISHMFQVGSGSHPAMYFLVWDMYCGWSAYEQRFHVVGEGESGRYYELAPGPWGELQPHGDIGRHHYDMRGSYVDRLARHTLSLTDHEPMHRIYLIEESWPKKYNFPDALWHRRYAHPKESHSYFHVRTVLDRNGTALKQQPDWLVSLNERNVLNNPRLRSDMHRGHTVFAAAPTTSTEQGVVPAGYEAP